MRVRRVLLEIAAEGAITLAMIGLLWLIERALDITHVGSHVLFQDAISGTSLQFGLRLGALFDLLHFLVLANFIYRSVRHANHTFRGHE